MAAFIQITDTHIVPEGQLAYGHSDTAAALEAAVATINKRLPAIGPIDCAIVTGDLTDHGTSEEYERFKAIMAQLELPYLAVPGNHDSHFEMRQAFSDQDWMPRSGPIQWCRDFGPFTLIGLDTLLDGAHHGVMCEDGFAFLDETLREIGGKPIVVATHHPWMHSGIREMDEDNLRNGMMLMQRLQDYPGPVRMISGHVHRTLTTQIGDVLCQIGPAPCHAVNRDHRGSSVNSLVMEPGAVSLYRWLDGSMGLISDVLPIGDFAGPWPFN